MMLLTLFVAACQFYATKALRPEVGKSTVAVNFTRLRQLTNSARSSPAKSASSLKATVSVMDSLLLDAGNATEHMSDEDQALLAQVIQLIRTTIYGSMNASHDADEGALAAAIEDIEHCNADVAARQAPGGDLDVLHQKAIGLQNEVNLLQGVVDEKRIANVTAWKNLADHIAIIPDAPECPEFPDSDRTRLSLDVFFEPSAYVFWYTTQAEAFGAKMDAHEGADIALKEAIDAYDVMNARRGIEYCDWKRVLEQACADFDACYTSQSEFYSNELMPRVAADAQSRIEAFQAGETLVAQVEFLLGTSASSEVPAIDTSRYEIDFSAVPAKGLCDLEPLTSPIWVPPIECGAPPPQGSPCDIDDQSCECFEHRDPNYCNPCREDIAACGVCAEYCGA